MSGLNIIAITAIMFGAMILLLFAGYPIAFGLISVGILATVFIWNTSALGIIMHRVYGLFSTLVLVAIPLFIFMGTILERSGIADDLYQVMYGTIGRLRGGLAMGTVIICTIMAAMVGVSGASTVTMSLVALPSMLRRNYDKYIATGSIMAGGALGILIPPSICMILFSLFAGQSVGRLFAGGVLPGLLLSTLFVLYIGVRCYLHPKLCPSVGKDEALNMRQAISSASKGLVLPIILIIAVLGSIFTGAATPTEASAVGAIGAIICALLKGRLTLDRLRQAMFETYRATLMVIWVALAAWVFTSVYIGLGAPELIKNTLTGLDVNPWVVMVIIQLTYFILGCFIDAVGIIILTTPIYVPIVQALGFDVVWFGILFTMNMEMALLTPPFAVNIFYVKGVAPKEITMNDLYIAVWPFVGLQALGLAIVMVFPQIALWLPNLLLNPK